MPHPYLASDFRNSDEGHDDDTADNYENQTGKQHRKQGAGPFIPGAGVLARRYDRFGSHDADPYVSTVSLTSAQDGRLCDCATFRGHEI